MSKFRYTTGIVALAIGCLSMTPVLAQDGAPGDEEATTDDIVVTANRTESFASKTPIALSAIAGKQLISAGVTNPTELGEQVPNLSIDRANGLQITIRGVTSSDGTEKGDPSAAFLTDGVYIARPQVQEVSFFDVSRVEVLRGPQGTLFGRNTTAGLVNVISNLPKLGVFSGSIDAAYASFNAVQATGVLNVPVGENIAVRAAVNYDQRDSILNAGPTFVSQLDPFKKNLSFRLSTLVETGSARLILRGDYSDIGGQTANILPVTNFYTNFATTASVPLFIGKNVDNDKLLTINLPFDGPLDRNNSTWGVTADFMYELGAVDFNYLGSYREFDRDESSISYRNSILAVDTLFEGKYTQSSHEARLSTSGTGPLRAQIGAYYFKEKSDINFYLFGFTTPVVGATGFTRAFKQGPTNAESYAFFGQLTYSLSDKFRVTGGVRYSNDDKSRLGVNAQCQTTACNLPTDVLVRNDAQRTFAKTTWRAGFDYDLNDATLLYGTVSTGYKSGGFNDGCLISSNPALCSAVESQLFYEPETITAYEGGLKTRFADDKVRLNLAVFHYDYANLQLSKTGEFCGPNSACRVTTNAAKAKIDGIEFETTILPVPTSRFDFAVNWLDARYTDYQQTATISFNGRALDRSPEWTATAGFTQTFELSNGGNVKAGVRTRLSDSYVLAALGTINQFRVEGYTKTDLTVSYNAPDDGWYLQAFAKNLEDALVVTTVNTGILGNLQVADPRTFGVRAGLKF